MTTLSASEWEVFQAQYPYAHLLQTSAWGDFKAEFGWQVERVAVNTTGAQVLFRRLPLGLSFAYIPKGPIGPDWLSLWPEIDRVCRRHRALVLKVEPDLDEPVDPRARGRFRGFYPAADPIQPRRTIVVSLEGDEESWLGRMKQKTRYNIRLAEKKEVSVRHSDDVDAFYDLMQITGERDRFGVHSRDYFRRAYDLFHPTGMCELLVAEYAGKLLAALMVFARGLRAWYFYGASSDAERNRMPAYLLQWEAMRWAKARGCEEYDLWGVPDADEEALEAGFSERSDGLWGVYRFKRGFGGRLIRSAGAWDKPFLPFIYPLYRWYERRRHESG
jgi:lipid II:glycine glycyltransferase (peptidoglycan interpeptide bridge formation enzyme)